MESKQKKNSFILIICLLSFLLGMVLSSISFVRQEVGRGLEFMGVRTNLETGYAGVWSGAVQDNNPLDLKLFQEAYSKVSENYYGFNTISEKDLISGMIKGFIDALGDKHSEYFNLDETKKFNEVLSGDFEGIGAVIDKNDFGVVVDRIIAWSPAKDAGVLAGDIITKANGQELKDLDLTDAVAKIRGPAGTTVELEIIRAGQKEVLTKTVTRRQINVPSVDGHVIEGTTEGYIALSIFGEKTADDFQKTLNDLYAKNVTGLIIDLRDNGGGYLETAVSILSNFVEKDKVLVTTKEKNPFLNQSYFSYGNTNKPLPIVVLVNENSASASEITAGALKDYKLAVLVGQKTYGKGSVQQPFTLSDGSEMKITVAKWYTPLDYGIDKVGITPDISVAFQKKDYETHYDRQLEVAKQVLDLFTKLKDQKKTIEEYNKTLQQQNTEGSGGTTK